MYYKGKGFTLIEILIVMGLIGALTGLLIATINPMRQQHRGRESTMRTNTEKMCFSLMACSSAEVDGTRCDDWGDIGVITPTNLIPGETYTIVANPAGDPNANVVITGSIPSFDSATDTCAYECSFNFGTVLGVDMQQVAGSVCMID